MMQENSITTAEMTKSDLNKNNKFYISQSTSSAKHVAIKGIPAFIKMRFGCIKKKRIAFTENPENKVTFSETLAN